MSIPEDYNHGYQKVNNHVSLTVNNFGNSLGRMTMGQRLRERRAELGWTQADVVERMVKRGWAISQPAIKKIEAGGGTGMVVELAAVLGLSALWLKTGDGPRLADGVYDEPHLYKPQLQNGDIPMTIVGLSFERETVPSTAVSIPLVHDPMHIESLGPGRAKIRPDVQQMSYETSHILSENAVAYRVIDGLFEPEFKAGFVFVFDPAVKPKTQWPVLVDIAGEIQVRLYRPLFGDVFELYIPSGAIGILRSDQAPIKILAGPLRAVLENEQS
jgi:transcriptional regulator with XRE-family HTH domain